MSWQTEVRPLLRVLINDLVVPYTYSDDSLDQLFVVASQMLITEVSSFSYEVSVSAVTITPDPTDPRNDDFINLAALKAACLVGQAEFKTATASAIAIRDGSSSIDLRGGADAKNILMTSFCDAYNKARQDYLFSGRGTLGSAIVSPFRIYLGGNGGPLRPIVNGPNRFN